MRALAHSKADRSTQVIYWLARAPAGCCSHLPTRCATRSSLFTQSSHPIHRVPSMLTARSTKICGRSHIGLCELCWARVRRHVTGESFLLCVAPPRAFSFALSLLFPQSQPLLLLVPARLHPVRIRCTHLRAQTTALLPQSVLPCLLAYECI